MPEQDDIFTFGPVQYSKPGSPNDGKRYGFVRDDVTARRFGYWSEADSYQIAPLDVAEKMSMAHGLGITEQNCAFVVMDDDVMKAGYVKEGPNGGMWINPKTLNPITGKEATALTKKYGEFIDFLATPVQV